MSTQITAPVKTEGRNETYFGSRLVVFQDGVATVDFDINDGLRAYLASAGYGFDGNEPRSPKTATLADPRDYDGPAQVGTDLRDAAVDPRSTDFLPPINAGQANPHGGEVVAPGIHAVGPGPIVPGTVGSADYQENKESGTAELVLIDGESVPKVTAALNGLARAEYDETTDKGAKKGLAQEFDGEVTAEHFTAVERELLGLDDEDEPDEDEPDEDEAVADSETLKGEALTEALKARDLPLTGSADERRQRVAEHDKAQG